MSETTAALALLIVGYFYKIYCQFMHHVHYQKILHEGAIHLVFVKHEKPPKS